MTADRDILVRALAVILGGADDRRTRVTTTVVALITFNVLTAALGGYMIGRRVPLGWAVMLTNTALAVFNVVVHGGWHP